MCTTIRIVLAMVREAFLSRAALHLENLALRQQLAALDRKGARPSLRMADRLFWVVLSRLWSGWREILVIVKPDRLLRRTHRDVQSSIRARCAAARASADCSHRHHGTPDCGVGRATDPGGLSVGDSTTVYDPRSGSCVRYCLSFADKGDGHRRGRDGAAIAVAVAVR